MDKLQIEKAMEKFKRKSGMTYTFKEKVMVLNVLKYLRQQHPEHSVSQVIQETSKATGCSEGSIYRFRKEESSVGGLKEPSKRRPRETPCSTSRDMKYNEDMRQTIREIVEGLKYTNIKQSLDSALMVVNADSRLPHFTRATLRRLLMDMGLKYKRISNRSVLVHNKFTGSRKRFSNKEPVHSATVEFVDTNPVRSNYIDQHFLYNGGESDEYMEEIDSEDEVKPLLVDIEQKPLVRK